LLDLDALNDTTPSPRPDTIYVRSGGNMRIRVVESRQALTQPVRLDNGVTTLLSDHAAVLVDLELSACGDCAASVLGNAGLRRVARSELVAAAAITPLRMTWALGGAASLLAVAVSFFRLTREPSTRSLRFRLFRRTSLSVLALGFVWAAYLGAFYYPSRAKALRFVAHELETPPTR
jgi:hypothetical protein